MCGIIGYAGTKQAAPVLLSGLDALEYRGYDSAGAAVFCGGKIKTIRTAGRISELRAKIESEKPEGTVGVAHTRWATHGEPSERNAHPHTGSDGVFTVVHNGIIENYLVLREKLSAAGRVFLSETDTEVISQLLEENYDGDPLAALQRTVAGLEGSFALGILCADFPERIYCACRESPLLAGTGGQCSLIASDTSAITDKADKIYRMQNGETAVLDKDGIAFFSPDGIRIEKREIKVDRNLDEVGKGNFEYFMEKEIYEQPEALKRTISEHISDGRLKAGCPVYGVNLIKKMFIVGCGSAFHAAVVGKYVFESLLKIPTEADLASEFRYREPLIDDSALVVIISQSGETADTLAALREATRRGARTISIVNVEGSSIARESEAVFMTRAGREVAVATTKAYSTQLAALYILALYIARETKAVDDERLGSLTRELSLLPGKVSEALNRSGEVLRAAEKYAGRSYAYYIGRNLDYASALEASLKLKEISYVHSEAYAAGELKHGTISLIEDGTLTVAMCCCGRLAKKTAGNIEEVAARGGSVLCVTTAAIAPLLGGDTKIITVPSSDELFMPSIEIIPMQLFSFFSAKLRKCDIDKPRNLAKSVTVE